uniref:Uncharacterized protein n=1 Tax=Glossina pallidipes TaxID=7398 RepID=A0A1A9ZH27_GLOPL
MRAIFVLSLVYFCVHIDGAPTLHLFRKHVQSKIFNNDLYGDHRKSSPTIIIQNSPHNVQALSQSDVDRRQLPTLSVPQVYSAAHHPIVGYNHRIGGSKIYSMSSSSSSSSANAVKGQISMINLRVMNKLLMSLVDGTLQPFHLQTLSQQMDEMQETALKDNN